MEVAEIFVLVHGTVPNFGPLRVSNVGTWAEDNSILCKTLAASFASSKMLRFKWTGGNSHAARKLAGETLACACNRGARGVPGPERVA